MMQFGKLEPQMPKTMGEYHELIQQALIEIDDLRNILQYEDDADGMEAAWSFIDDLENHLKTLAAEVADGSHEFNGENLPYMKLILRQPSHVLPFKRLLDEINKIHRQGLMEK